jgi:hypothetical protein
MDGCDPVNPCGRCARCRQRRRRRIALHAPVRSVRQPPAARVREAYKAYWDAETDADFRRAKERVKKALRAYRRAHEGTRSRED